MANFTVRIQPDGNLQLEHVETANAGQNNPPTPRTMEGTRQKMKNQQTPNQLQENRDAFPSVARSSRLGITGETDMADKTTR